MTSSNPSPHRPMSTGLPSTSPRANEDGCHKPFPAILQRMPNTAFGIAIGLSGNAVMWRSIESSPFLADRLDAGLANEIFWFAGLGTFFVVGLAYLHKMLYHWSWVVQEYRNPARVHFMNSPHIVLIMLTIAVPRVVNMDELILDVIFAISLAAQTLFTQFVYQDWLFNSESNLSHARPQFFLSTVGWFLLANLGLSLDIEERWGIAIPAFCLGTGFFLYAIVVISIFNFLHEDQMQAKGSPGMTLLLAPPSVGVIALEGIAGDGEKFPVIAQCVLGWVLIAFLLLIKIGPRILATPPSLGAYWAYVFPLAALATACVRYAAIADTTATRALASASVTFATLALCIVFCRTSFHAVRCIWFDGHWGDPLLGIPSRCGRDMQRWKRNYRWCPEMDDMDISPRRRMSVSIFSQGDRIEANPTDSSDTNNDVEPELSC